VARQVPSELCAIDNARATDTPALFVMSGRDRLVPPHYQRQIIGAHRGPQRLLVLPHADHASSMEEDERRRYASLLRWLLDNALLRHRKRTSASS
jgi:pimeloyl-ACP methyl ester carboxylesterase